MSLLSALDDLLQRTLSAFPGLLSRLEYLSSLRHPETGVYSHWGLSRVHGDVTAQNAIQEAHGLLVSEILHMPLRKLMDDAVACGTARGEDAEDYLQDLLQRCSVLLPQQLGGGSSRHFSSVLHALSALAHSQGRATRRDA